MYNHNNQLESFYWNLVFSLLFVFLTRCPCLRTQSFPIPNPIPVLHTCGELWPVWFNRGQFDCTVASVASLACVTRVANWLFVARSQGCPHGLMPQSSSALIKSRLFSPLELCLISTIGIKVSKKHGLSWFYLHTHVCLNKCLYTCTYINEVKKFVWCHTS